MNAFAAAASSLFQQAQTIIGPGTGANEGKRQMSWWSTDEANALPDYKRAAAVVEAPATVDAKMQGMAARETGKRMFLIAKDASAVGYPGDPVRATRPRDGAVFKTAWISAEVPIDAPGDAVRWIVRSVEEHSVMAWWMVEAVPG